MIVISRFRIESQKGSDTIDIGAHGFVNFVVFVGRMVVATVLMEIKLEICTAQTCHLAFDTNIFRVIMNVLLKELPAASVFSIGRHVGSCLASAIDGHNEDRVAATLNLGHGNRVMGEYENS